MATVTAPGERDMLFYRDGRTATVSSVRVNATGQISLATNGKPDASLGHALVPAPATRPAGSRSPVDAATQALTPAHHAGAHAERPERRSHRLRVGNDVARPARQPRSSRKLVTIEIEPRMVDGRPSLLSGQPAGVRRPPLPRGHRRRQVLLRLGAPAVRRHPVRALESVGQRRVRPVHLRVLRPSAAVPHRGRGASVSGSTSTSSTTRWS